MPQAPQSVNARNGAAPSRAGKVFGMRTGKTSHWVRPYFPVALFLCAAVAGCGRDDPPPPKVEPTANPIERAARGVSEALRQGEVGRAGEAVRQMGEGISSAVRTEPVDFKALQAWLPQGLGSLKRQAVEGGRTGVAGVALAKATATYEGPGNARGRIEVRDAGGLSGVASLAVSWLNIDIDRQGASGYERTVNAAGRKAYERFAAGTQRGDYDVIVGGRFLVSLEVNGIDAKAFQDIVARLDLGALDALASRPAAAGGAGPAGR